MNQASNRQATRSYPNRYDDNCNECGIGVWAFEGQITFLHSTRRWITHCNEGECPMVETSAWITANNGEQVAAIMAAYNFGTESATTAGKRMMTSEIRQLLGLPKTMEPKASKPQVRWEDELGVTMTPEQYIRTAGRRASNPYVADLIAAEAAGGHCDLPRWGVAMDIERMVNADVLLCPNGHKAFKKGHGLWVCSECRKAKMPGDVWAKAND